MELFSSNLLKNEYENFKKDELLKVLECGCEMFLKNTDEIGKDYLCNFISDFLNINRLTL